MAAPTRPEAIRRPAHRGRPATRDHRAWRQVQGLLGTLRGLPGSPRQRCDHAPPQAPATVLVARSLQVMDARATRQASEGPGPRFPRVGGSPLCRPSTGSPLVRGYGRASTPFGPLVTETTSASAFELQRPKPGKDFHLLTGEAARRTARRRGPPRGAGRARLHQNAVPGEVRPAVAGAEPRPRWSATPVVLSHRRSPASANR